MFDNDKLLVNEVHNILSKNKISLEKEIINLKYAYKKVISNKLYYKIDDPPFNKAAMDGYGYYDNGSRKFELLEEIFSAGSNKTDINILENCCIKIMTGAMVPDNINKISKFEAADIVEENGKKYVYVKEEENSNNIILKSTSSKIGDLLLDIKRLDAEDISRLASNGFSEIEVFKSPKVAVISTGSELIEIGNKLEIGKIYDSNGFLIVNKLKDIDIDSKFYGIVKDEYDSLYSVISGALKENDIVIVNGGISFGNMDYSKRVFNDLGVEKLCHGVSIKPGKPFYFGVKKDGNKINKAIFGIPGNPFASLVSIENFVKPYINNCMGIRYDNCFYKFPLYENYKRKNSKAEEYYPVDFITNDKGTFVKLLDYKGSFYLPANMKALMKINIGINEIKAFENVEIKFI